MYHTPVARIPRSAASSTSNVCLAGASTALGRCRPGPLQRPMWQTGICCQPCWDKEWGLGFWAVEPQGYSVLLLLASENRVTGSLLPHPALKRGFWSWLCHVGLHDAGRTWKEGRTLRGEFRPCICSRDSLLPPWGIERALSFLPRMLLLSSVRSPSDALIDWELCPSPPFFGGTDLIFQADWPQTCLHVLRARLQA